MVMALLGGFVLILAIADCYREFSGGQETNFLDSIIEN